MHHNLSKEGIWATFLALGRLDGAVAHCDLKHAWQLRAAIIGFAAGHQLKDKSSFYLSLLRGDDRKDLTLFRIWYDRLIKTKRLEESPSLSFDMIQNIFDGDDLTLPTRLYQYGVTQTPLPCLTQPKNLQRQSQQGLRLLADLNKQRHRFASRLSHGKHDLRLWQVAALSLKWPALTPSSAARDLGISISGAGKLLQRAEDLGLLVETTGRHNYKLYIARDSVRELGFTHLALPRDGASSLPAPMDQNFELALKKLDDILKTLEPLI